MYKIKKAFTLAEILIAMLVLGVLIALIMPQFTHLVTEKRRQVTANSYMKVYTDIENAIEEYSLINYSSPDMFYRLGTDKIINALKPYLRIIEVSGNDQFTLYDGTIVKVGKKGNANSIKDTKMDPTNGTPIADNSPNVVVFAYQRPNTFIAQVIYTNNGNTYFACKANCDNDEVFKLMSSKHQGNTDKDGNSLSTSNSNLDIIKNSKIEVTPPVSKHEDDDKGTSST